MANTTKTTVYRAANHGRLGPDEATFCCSAELETARAYLGGDGYGGSTLYRYEIVGEIIDVDCAKLAELARSVGYDDEYCARVQRQAFVYQALDNLGAWEVLVEAGIVAVRYADEYPVGALTIAYYGQTLHGEEVE